VLLCLHSMHGMWPVCTCILSICGTNPVPVADLVPDASRVQAGDSDCSSITTGSALESNPGRWVIQSTLFSPSTCNCRGKLACCQRSLNTLIVPPQPPVWVQGGVAVTHNWSSSYCLVEFDSRMISHLYDQLVCTDVRSTTLHRDGMRTQTERKQ
jgi:hypothetical protein